MLTVTEVISKIKDFDIKLQSEPVNLLNGLGRVIADDVKSRGVMPPFDMCNINGYAINTADLTEIPAVFTKIGTSKNKKVFDGELGANETVLVNGSVPIPEGANAIVPIDKIEKISNDKIMVQEYVTMGENISTAGIDVSEGDIIFSKGTILTSRHIALASILNVPWLPVIKSPRVGIIVCTEDDIEDIGATKKISKLYNTNSISISIAAFINARGGVATNLGTALDISAPVEQIMSFKHELSNALKSVDMLVTVGGIASEPDNLLFTSLIKQGAKIDKHSASIGNGENILMGSINNIPIIGLPGHQVSSLICAALFLKPAIDAMLNIEHLKKIYATLSRNLDEFDLRNDYLYAKLVKQDNGDLIVSPISGQDSLMLSVVTETDCIIVLDDKENLKMNSPVEIIMFGGSIMST